MDSTQLGAEALHSSLWLRDRSLYAGVCVGEMTVLCATVPTGLVCL